ncbi:MAG: DUF3179 domain-containing protein [Planctomycetes bacterium]|nr:DUF3179 domain-containing protein [Planctomycetota bacterium]
MRFRLRHLVLLVLVAAASGFAAGYATRDLHSTGSAPQRRVERAQSVVDTDSDAKTVASVDAFITLTQSRDRVALFDAITTIEQQWHPGSAIMFVESVRFIRSNAIRAAAINVLQDKTGKQFGPDLNAWYRWIWQQEYEPHPVYPKFKAELYSRLDERFHEYFANADDASIRLDEVRWGGVRRDGIPPLKDPATLAASDAGYLSDSDVVFGVEINGEARAYPKRILAWHEMVKDTIGGESINGVYCTLCGSMIVYRTHIGDKHYELGTSGFLYRSNKLMYDHATKSLWSTLDGEPVVGSLVGQGIKLEPLSVVTTTWGSWRAEHPETAVLSLATGHRRDYGEGIAYRDYFATDELMFAVPNLDARLKNKDEVLAIRLDDRTDEKLAISAVFLATRRIYHDRLGETGFVVLTDESGANRVYESKELKFAETLASGRLQAEDGSEWDIGEAALISRGGEESLARLPAHRAFWFGWHAAFPRTRLVK